MGQIRLSVGPVDRIEENVPLPDHWDELDEDERAEYVRDVRKRFAHAVAPVTVEVTDN